MKLNNLLKLLILLLLTGKISLMHYTRLSMSEFATVTCVHCTFVHGNSYSILIVWLSFVYIGIITCYVSYFK